MTLTEKWKKGELEQGEYWCKITESPYVERVYLPCCDNIIVEVLAPVPTYQEYLESEAHCAVYSDRNKWLKEENVKLKEFLKDCVVELQDFNNSSYPTVENLLTRINAAIGESEE